MAPFNSREDSIVGILYSLARTPSSTISHCNYEKTPTTGGSRLSKILTPAVAITRQIRDACYNALINKDISNLCTLLAFQALKGRRGPRIQAEETMQRTDKNNAHDEIVCITSNGAAARCALGLLVVVVLLLAQ